MAIHLEDRWYRYRLDGADIRTARYGQAPRYRAHFSDSSSGTRKTKTFHHRHDAERWLVKTEVAHLLKGHA